MTDEFRGACAKVRESLLEAAVAGDPETGASGFEEHLRSCSTCRGYAEGLLRVPGLLPRPPLYGDALRARALAAAGHPSRRRDGLFAALAAPPFVLLSLLAFGLPAWLLASVLSPLVGSPWLALAASVAIVHAAGALPAGLCAALAIRQHTRIHRFQEVIHE